MTPYNYNTFIPTSIRYILNNKHTEIFPHLNVILSNVYSTNMYVCDYLRYGMQSLRKTSESRDWMTVFATHVRKVKGR